MTVSRAAISRALVDDYAAELLPELTAGLAAAGVQLERVGYGLPSNLVLRTLGHQRWVAVIGGRTAVHVRERTAQLVALLTGPVPVIAVAPRGVTARGLRGPHIVDVLSPDTPRCAERVLLMAAVPVVTKSKRLPPAEVAGGAAAHPAAPGSASSPSVVAIASSTGGISVVIDILRDLGGQTLEAVLLAQHIQAEFVGLFAEWLSETSGWPVEVVASAAALRPGTVFLAAGGHDLVMDHDEVRAVPSSSQLIPNADRLFRSLAGSLARWVVGVVLSGMGTDGAAGLAELARAGGGALCQMPGTAAIGSMPAAAIKSVPAVVVRAPAELADAIRRALREQDGHGSPPLVLP